MKFCPMKFFFSKFFLLKIFCHEFFFMKIEIFFYLSKNHLKTIQKSSRTFQKLFSLSKGAMGAIRAFFLFQMKMYTVLKNRNRWRFLQWKGRFGLGQITGLPVRFGSNPQCSAPQPPLLQKIVSVLSSVCLSVYLTICLS